MDRVYESGASAIAPTPPAVPSTGFPSRGNPGTGTMPTVPGPYMMHSLVEEIMAVISAAGIAPDKAVLNQLKLALDSIYMSKNGTSALLQNFAGLTRSMTALGGGLVREYVDITNAATVGGIEIGVVYNCAVNPTTGVWAGRDIADICWLEKWHDTAGTKEFWFAPTAAAGAVPVWVNVFSLNANNGNMNISGSMNCSSLNGGQLSGFRNKIINGDMQVSQVNGATAVTPAHGVYPVDQWVSSVSVASKFTFQQVVDAPAGFRYSLKISVATQYAPLATDVFVIQQPVEGQNIIDLGMSTATPATIAVSLWVKGSVPGTYSCAIRNGAVSRSYIGTITVGTTWAKQTIVLVGDTAGIWANDNTAGLYLSIDLGSGTNANSAAGAWMAGSLLRTVGSTSFVNQVVGSTLNITGVQLEQVSAGATQGTAFEHVSYADQLRWCQRYFALITCGSGIFTSANASSSTHPIPVPLRAAPTVGFIGAGSVAIRYDNVSVAVGYLGSASMLDNAMFLSLTFAAVGTIGKSICITADGQIIYADSRM